MPVTNSSITLAPRLVTRAGDVYDTAAMIIVPLGITATGMNTLLTDAGAGATITFTPGNYEFDATWGSTVQNDQRIVCTGAVFYSNHAGACVHLGEGTRNIRRVIIEDVSVRRGSIAGGLSPDWTPGCVGFRWHNADYCKAFHVRSEGYYNGAQFYGSDGRGCSYSLITIKNVSSCHDGLVCWAQGTGSWCNDNTFREGSVSYAGADPDASTGYHIVLDAGGGGNAPNMNRFRDIALEAPVVTAGKPAGAIYNNGEWNMFSWLRMEGEWATGPFSDKDTILIYEGASASGRSVYENCLGLVGPSNISPHTFGSPVSAATHYSTIFGNDGALFSGAVIGVPVLTLNQLNSQTEPSIQFTFRGYPSTEIDAYGRIRIATGSGLDLSTNRSLIDVAPDVAATARGLVRIVVPSGSPAYGLEIVNVGTGDCLRAAGTQFRILADGSINAIANTSNPHYLNIIKAVTLSAFDGHVTIGQSSFSPIFEIRETSNNAKRTVQFVNVAGSDCTYFDGQGRFISAQSIDIGAPTIIIAPNTAQTGAGHLQLFMPTGTTIPGLVLGTLGTGDLMQASGTNCRISSGGALQVVPSIAVGSPTSFDGVRVLAIGNRATAPTAVVGGGVLFADAGALKWLGSSGTTTTIAPA